MRSYENDSKDKAYVTYKPSLYFTYMGVVSGYKNYLKNSYNNHPSLKSKYKSVPMRWRRLDTRSEGTVGISGQSPPG